MNWLLIATIAIVAWSMVSGYMKGLIRIVYSFVSWIMVMCGSVFAAPYLREYIEKNTQINEMIYEQVNKSVEGNDILTNSGYEMVDMLLGKTGIYKELSYEITQVIMNAMSFFAVMAMLGIIFLFIGRMIWGVEKLPIIGVANRMAGTAVGFARGMIMVWLLFSIITIAGTSKMGMKLIPYIKESVLLNIIYEYNPILDIIVRVGK